MSNMLLLYIIVLNSASVLGFFHRYTNDLLTNDKKAENPHTVVLEEDVLFCTKTCQTDPRCMVFGFHSSRKECYLYHRFINSSQEVLQSDPGMWMFSYPRDSDNIARNKMIITSTNTQGDLAVDGNLTAPCFRTNELDFSPYLVISLDDVYLITMVTMYNVPDDYYPERLHDVNIEVFYDNPVDNRSAPSTCCASTPGILPPGPTSVKCQHGVVGKYVKVYIERSEFLTLCEVEVFGVQVSEPDMNTLCNQEKCTHIPSGENIALNKTATQSSQWGAHSPGKAVDGSLVGRGMQNAHCSSTNIITGLHWLQVDLAAIYNITTFTILNRWDDRSNKERLSNITVAVYQTDPTQNSQATPTVCKYIPGMFGQTVRTFTCDDVTIGRYGVLEICELEIQGTLI